MHDEGLSPTLIPSTRNQGRNRHSSSRAQLQICNPSSPRSIAPRRDHKPITGIFSLGSRLPYARLALGAWQTVRQNAGLGTMKLHRVHSRKNWPLRSEGKFAVLVISTISEDYTFLFQVLSGMKLTVHFARTLEDASVQMSTRPVVAVLSEDTLPDGDWRSVLAGLARSSPAPKLIVTSGLADDALWAEVLSLGGYDVLAKPFDTEEVRRVVGFACGSR